MQAPKNAIRIGDTSKRLATCFGVGIRLPVNIPVWVADVNCESQAYADNLVQLRAADNGYQADYADLASGKNVTALRIFLRAPGYRSPEPMTFKDVHGTFQQPGQVSVFNSDDDDDDDDDNTIIITVKGGMVVDVEGLPDGFDYTIDDQDV